MKWHKQINWPLTGLVFAAITFHWMINHMHSVRGLFSWLIGLVSPFLLGCAIAFVLNVPMRQIEHKLFSEKSKLSKTLQRVIAYSLTLMLLVVVIGLALFVIIPQVGESMRTLIDQIPNALRAAQLWLTETASRNPEIAAWIMDFDFSGFHVWVNHIISSFLRVNVWT